MVIAIVPAQFMGNRMLRSIVAATSITTIAVSALIVTGALLAGSVVFLTSIALEAKAETLTASALQPVLAKSDRLPATMKGSACSSQSWPNYDRNCQFDLRQAAGDVVKVRVLDLSR